MKIKNLRNRAVIFLISAIVSLSLFLIVFKYAEMERDRLHESERLSISERYTRFQSALESLINDNITILNGYMAFLSMGDVATESSSIEYLENLVDENSSYIKNISTIEDTTIKFVYPSEGNESATGIDLAEVEDQRAPVLAVKESLKPVFQGPIDLVQGGTGFVARIPTLDSSGNYSGQISLVISGTAFLSELDRLSKLHGLDVVLYSVDSSADDSFYGSPDVLDENPLVFFLDSDYVSWNVAAIPYGGWTEDYDSIRANIRLGGLFSIFTFVSLFFSIDLFDQSKVKLREKNFEITSQKNEIEALYEESFAMNQELEYMVKVNKKNFFDTVSSLVHALDAKDTYTGGHSQRVKEYSLKAAEKLGLDESSKETLSFGSILHDIGKIGIPEDILNKEGPLTDEEYRTIVRHPHIGYKIIEDLDLSSSTKRIVHEHHERVDGRGYPNRLKGEEIHLFSRIVCIADAFDAMTSQRSYREFPMTHSEAITELERNRGTQFDGNILDAFIAVLEEEISETEKDPAD